MPRSHDGLARSSIPQHLAVREPGTETQALREQNETPKPGWLGP